MPCYCDELGRLREDESRLCNVLAKARAAASEAAGLAGVNRAIAGRFGAGGFVRLESPEGFAATLEEFARPLPQGLDELVARVHKSLCSLEREIADKQRWDRQWHEEQRRKAEEAAAAAAAAASGG